MMVASVGTSTAAQFPCVMHARTRRSRSAIGPTLMLEICSRRLDRQNDAAPTRNGYESRTACTQARSVGPCNFHYHGEL